MSVIMFVGAWAIVLSRSKKWWNAAWFWFVLAIVNEVFNPICPGLVTRSIFYFLSSFGFLVVVTGYFRPKEFKKNNSNEEGGEV